IDFDENMVRSYDELPLWSSPFGILLLNNIPLQRNFKIVDIGCGTGFPLLELAQRFGDSCKFYGIDPWETAIERANRKREQYRIKNVEILKGVGENLPFNNEYIDIIISNLGINNFEKPDDVISECFRVLNPKGKLIFTTNLCGHFDEFYSVFKDVIDDLNFENEINNLNKHINKRHSIEDITILMNRNKFSIKKIVQDNYVMRFVDGSSFLNHYFIKLAFLQDWKEIIKEDDWNNVFSKIEDRLNHISSKKGELLFNSPIAYIECEKEI
ncbi:MAG: class I SAM-dependent methyltransferase, partial [Bacillota bacterium]|nr:class I SAM-dependent methyltransferase [Bacillota bacterium]